MTARVVPSQGAFGAAVAEVREPRSVATVLAAPLWLGFWAWHDWHSDSAAAGLVLGVMGVVLGGLTFHRLVRRRRGVPGTHWASPVVAGVVMALLYAAANAVEPVIDASAIAVLVGGTFVVLTICTIGENVLARRHLEPVTAPV